MFETHFHGQVLPVMVFVTDNAPNIVQFEQLAPVDGVGVLPTYTSEYSVAHV